MSPCSLFGFGVASFLFTDLCGSLPSNKREEDEEKEDEEEGGRGGGGGGEAAWHQVSGRLSFLGKHVWPLSAYLEPPAA